MNFHHFESKSTNFELTQLLTTNYLVIKRVFTDGDDKGITFTIDITTKTFFYE